MDTTVKNYKIALISDFVLYLGSYPKYHVISTVKGHYIPFFI